MKYKLGMNESRLCGWCFFLSCSYAAGTRSIAVFLSKAAMLWFKKTPSCVDGSRKEHRSDVAVDADVAFPLQQYHFFFFSLSVFWDQIPKFCVNNVVMYDTAV